MPPVIPDAPWWANLALIMGGIAISSATTLLVTWLTMRRKLEQVSDQVVNDHGREPTNMRDDIDKISDVVERIDGTLDVIQANQRRHDRELARLYDADQTVLKSLTQLQAVDQADRERFEAEHRRIWAVLNKVRPAAAHHTHPEQE